MLYLKKWHLLGSVQLCPEVVSVGERMCMKLDMYFSATNATQAFATWACNWSVIHRFCCGGWRGGVFSWSGKTLVFRICWFSVTGDSKQVRLCQVLFQNGMFSKIVHILPEQYTVFARVLATLKCSAHLKISCWPGPLCYIETNTPQFWCEICGANERLFPGWILCTTVQHQKCRVAHSLILTREDCTVGSNDISLECWDKEISHEAPWCWFRRRNLVGFVCGGRLPSTFTG